MKQFLSLPNWITLTFLIFVLNSQAQDHTKIETVKSSIDEIIQDIYAAADTIEHIDQINSIYEAGSYVKLKNLIEYYEGLGGPNEEVTKYKVHSKVLEDLLLTRKNNLDIGNIIDLDYQAEVEAEINDLTEQLKNADANELYSIRRDFDLLQSIFDINMRHNSVVDEWKGVTGAKLNQLKFEIEEKSESLGKEK